jgi:hypothetical protein
VKERVSSRGKHDISSKVNLLYELHVVMSKDKNFEVTGHVFTFQGFGGCANDETVRASLHSLER